ncbi:MAG TPA: outer membrane beta-barrel protein [Afipia sp.]
MRKFAVLLLAAAGFGLSQAASAADLGTAPIYRKAPPAPVYTWTGSYIGGFVGGAFPDKNTTTTYPLALGVLPATYKSDSSFIGGYTGGYNLQLAPNWLIGYEGETGYLKLKGSAGYPTVPGAFAQTESSGLYSVWSARFGYVADRSLFYVKGGAALAQFNSVYADGGLYLSSHKYVFGYAAGAGWEYAIDPKWSVKAEYLYLGFDKTFGLGAASTSVSGVHTGKVGVNYKWDWLSLLR